MLADHVRVSAMRGRVLRRPAQHFGQECGDMLRVFAIHVGEDRGEDFVVVHALIEACGQAVEGVEATGPLVEGRDAIGHS